jgi:hypothetical protein
MQRDRLVTRLQNFTFKELKYISGIVSAYQHFFSLWTNVRLTKVVQRLFGVCFLTFYELATTGLLFSLFERNVRNYLLNKLLKVSDMFKEQEEIL